jgi:hypothetical protein
MLVLSFDGWFQCRLATDPDPADEPRGVTGWTFAVGDEPDLDRVIRFQNPPVLRSPGPQVGVNVRAVQVDEKSVAGHPMVGAAVELLGQPKFEGRNGLVAEDGEELIDPFQLRIAGGGVVLERTDLLDPRGQAIPDVSPGFLRRRMAGGLQRDQASVNDVLKAIQVPSVKKHREDRLSALKEKRDHTSDEDARAALEKRIRSAGQLMPYRVRYAFDIGEFGLAGTVSGDDSVLLRRLDPIAPWPLALWLGGWDPDALCGFASGQLAVPFLPGG